MYPSATTKCNRLAGADPGFPVGGGGANPRWRGRQPRHRCFSAKTYVKMKEFGPVGGGGAPETFVCRSATDWDQISDINLNVRNLCGDFYRPRELVSKGFTHVCLYVCLFVSLCFQTIAFESNDFLMSFLI